MMWQRGLVWAVGAAVALGGAVLEPAPAGAQELRSILSRAVSDFDRGRLEASAAGFDRVAELAPGVAPQLWQRGITLYYVGRYRDCREQFESHRTVNPNDVENAAWHFLCVARQESPERALAALLPVGPDPRIPMTEIYEMFRGETTPDDVLAAGERGGERGRFYAHLYVGLYHEALGRAGEALVHITEAADERFEAVGGYMQMVARVHRIELDRAR